MATDPQDESWLAAFLDREAYEEAEEAFGEASPVERIDTHISQVFLTPLRVYKLRRAVTLSFLDFSRPEERLADCLRELRLNRRLAPDVYLGLAPVFRSASKVKIGSLRETPLEGAIEHAVVMRRLPAGRDLRSLLSRGEAGFAHMDRIAERIARFHREQALGPAPGNEGRWLAQSTAPARANVAALAEVPPALAPPAKVEEARLLGERFLEKHRADFEARYAAGRAVDGHGDLHTEHVWFESADAEPIFVDCVEFRDDFRRLDAASDVAFLAMDLEYRGHRALASRFLRRYARAAGDWHLYSVVDYFLSYRALVRAKVAALVAGDASIAETQREGARESVRRHLELGLELLRERPAGRLLLVCGLIGSGKTTVAEEIADLRGAVVISSDWLRRSDPVLRDAKDRYSDAGRSAVYERMLDAAAAVVASGRDVILDASWAQRRWREAAREWAARHAAGVALVEVTAPREEVLERLSARAAAGNDASEAGPGLYDAFRASFEAPDEWPREACRRVDSSAADWKDELGRIARELF